jgi:hypothetical protein
MHSSDLDLGAERRILLAEGDAEIAAAIEHEGDFRHRGLRRDIARDRDVGDIGEGAPIITACTASAFLL